MGPKSADCFSARIFAHCNTVHCAMSSRDSGLQGVCESGAWLIGVSDEQESCWRSPILTLPQEKVSKEGNHRHVTHTRACNALYNPSCSGVKQCNGSTRRWGLQYSIHGSRAHLAFPNCYFSCNSHILHFPMQSSYPQTASVLRSNFSLSIICPLTLQLGGFQGSILWLCGFWQHYIYPDHSAKDMFAVLGLLSYWDGTCGRCERSPQFHLKLLHISPPLPWPRLHQLKTKSKLF